MQMLKAEDALIQSWDIGVLHRERPSGDDARAAVTWARLPADHIDTMLDAYRARVLPRLIELPGFCSLSMVVDRKQGRTVSVTSFDSRESLELTRKQARSMREEFARAVSARIHDVAEMDVVVAHLQDALEDVVPRLQIPVLVLYGDQDRLCTREWAQELGKTAPDGRFQTLPGAHSFVWTAPEAWCEPIERLAREAS